MKWNPSNPKGEIKPKSIKKTIVINCFTGEEREVDRRRIKIIDGVEVGNTRVELDNGLKLAVAGEGKYHTLGNPKERWGEVAEVRVLPDGEYGDGELLGWTPLFSPAKPKSAPAKKGAPRKGQSPSASQSGKKQPSKGQSIAKPAAKANRPAPEKAAGQGPSRQPTAAGKLPPRPKKPNRD
ncbi:MAG: hypothetical protein PHE47_03875 [Oscillospiraceae bacterium]|nr:hypothetical protein [Oscillospiraceae bacterium]